jgi:hypothetical protein
MKHSLLLAALALFGCMPNGQPLAAPEQPAASAPVPAALPPNSHARDFFPTATGSRWTYEVTLTGAAPPLLHTEIEKPIGDGQHGLVANRGVPLALRDTPDLAGTHRLELSIQGRAKHDPNVLELAVEVDDLGLFAPAREVFYAVRDAERFMAALVTTHEGDGETNHTRPRTSGLKVTC